MTLCITTNELGEKHALPFFKELILINYQQFGTQ
jgi:hypothetical protein